jgi:pentapeptide repeat protein/YDG domain-containing protein
MVSVSGLAISGTDAANYTVDGSASAAIGIVDPKALTVTPNAVSTTYTAMTLDNGAYSDNTANYAISGLASGENVASAGITLSGILAFNGSPTTVVRNAGSYAQALGTLTLTSAFGNYVVAFSNPVPNSYVINPAPLIIAAAENTKIYDKTTSSVVTPTASGLLGGDTITGLAQVFDTAPVGIGTKTISVSAYTANDGNGGKNYAVTTTSHWGSIIAKGANLSGFDLSNQNLFGDNLGGYNLSGANAAGAIFQNVNLSNGNLKNVNFTNTNLQGANLKGANIRGAIFTGANLSGATWTNGKICQTGSIGTCN